MGQEVADVRHCNAEVSTFCRCRCSLSFMRYRFLSFTSAVRWKDSIICVYKVRLCREVTAYIKHLRCFRPVHSVSDHFSYQIIYAQLVSINYFRKVVFQLEVDLHVSQ